MKVEGYKINSYNATYEKVLLDVITVNKNPEEDPVIEVSDVNTGMGFIFEYRQDSKHGIKRQRR